MLVRTQPNGQWFCANQPSHAIMAAQFCYHWGNQDFAKPDLYELVMNAIAQHDNGWYEWESAPEIDADGKPLAFIPGPSYHVKLPIWQLGIDRATAQHPYMGLMVSRHAALLYTDALDILKGAEKRTTSEFIAYQDRWTETIRQQFAADATLRHAASAPVLLANTRLLQFGDFSSLQVTMPWSETRRFEHCPTAFTGDFTGDTANAFTAITMQWEGQEITYDPWPFGVDHFTVSIHGRLLDPTPFPDHATYRAALAAAPFHTLTWHVARS